MERTSGWWFVHRSRNFTLKETGWVDLTTTQVDVLDNAPISILAVRMPNEAVVYFNFKQVKPQLTKQAMKNNKREGDHWKLHIWPDRITVLGNQEPRKSVMNTTLQHLL